MFLAAPTAFFVTVFLFCGRTLLPITRGLSATQVHLLIPFSLLFLYALAGTVARSKTGFRKAVFVALCAVSIMGLYILGGHETIYAAAALGPSAATQPLPDSHKQWYRFRGQVM